MEDKLNCSKSNISFSFFLHANKGVRVNLYNKVVTKNVSFTSLSNEDKFMAL